MGRFFFNVPVSGNRTYYSWEWPGFLDWANLLDEVGTWRWTVQYFGDARNEPVTSGCAEEPVSVGIRTASVGLYNQPFQVPVGSPIYGTAYANGFRMTGTMQLRVFRPSDPNCSGPAAFTESFHLFGGSFGESFTFSTPPVDEVGTWRMQVSYPGDANNTPASVPCGSASTSATRTTPTLITGPASATVVVGSEIQANAALSGAYRATGQLRFRLFGPADPSCSFPVASKDVAVDPNGMYVQAPFTLTGVGRWRMTVEYPGDPLNQGASAGCGAMAVEVTKAVPVVVPVAIPTTSEAGGQLGAWAALDGGYQLTGRLLLRLFAPTDTACGGVPAHVEEAVLTNGAGGTSIGFSVPKSEEGTWNWTVTYLGDDNNATIVTGCGQAPVQVVAKRATPEPSTAPPFETNVYFNCLADHNIGVPSGSRLVLRIGWRAKTERQVRQFVSGIETRLTVDGVEVDADRYWSKPVLEPAGNPDAPWITHWVYDTRRTVLAGAQRFAIEFRETATKSITDGFEAWDAGDVLVSTGACYVDGF